MTHDREGRWSRWLDTRTDRHQVSGTLFSLPPAASIGWWDERNGRARWGDVNGLWEITTAVIARDGALAVLAVDDGSSKPTQMVAYVCRGKRRLGKARVLARIPATEPVQPRSLSISATTIDWRTQQRADGSVPRDERGCRRARVRPEDER